MTLPLRCFLLIRGVVDVAVWSPLMRACAALEALLRRAVERAPRP